MTKTIVLATLMCLLISVSDIMAAGSSTRMRQALDRAWRAQVAKEKARDEEAAKLEKELKDLGPRLFDDKNRCRRIL
jgi:hypothetical protein